ncbi:MAG: TolC family protein [Candidatus Sumerlaeia bacterium]|nr:TolC family protein [Candidatus Sumerlaeia bacterium]
MLGCMVAVSSCAPKSASEMSSSPEGTIHQVQLPETLEKPESPSLIVKDSPLSLEELESVLLARNPELSAARSRVQAAEGRLREAGNPPNPALLLSDGSVGTGPGGIGRGREAGVEQEILLPGRLGAAKNVEAAILEQSKLAAAQLELELRRDLREVLARMTANQLLEQHFWGVIELVDSAVKHAQTEGERLRLETERTDYLLSITALAVENSRLGNQLEELFNQPDFNQVPVSQLPKVWQADLNTELLRVAGELNAENTLEVRGAEYGVRRESAYLEQVRKRIWENPSVSLGAGQDDSGDETTARLGVRIPLPLFARQQGNLQEAEAIQDESKSMKEATRQRVVREVRDLIQSANELDTFVLEYRNNLLPWSKTAYEEVANRWSQRQADPEELIAQLERYHLIAETLVQYEYQLTVTQIRLWAWKESVGTEVVE